MVVIGFIRFIFICQFPTAKKQLKFKKKNKGWKEATLKCAWFDHSNPCLVCLYLTLEMNQWKLYGIALLHLNHSVSLISDEADVYAV